MSITVRNNPDVARSTDPLEFVKAARFYLVKPDERPYLAYAAMSLELVNRPDVGTAAVDSSWRMYFNPEFMMAGDVSLAAAIMEHEIWHLLKRHAERAKRMNVTRRTHTLWNFAADAEIHSDTQLVERIQKMMHLYKDDSEPITAESTFQMESGLTAEEYYRALMDRTEIREFDDHTTVIIHPPEQDEDEGEDGEGQGDGEGEGQEGEQGDGQQGAGAGQGGEPQQGAGAGQGGTIADEVEDPEPGKYPDGTVVKRISKEEAQVGAGNSGSSATGIPAAWEDAPTDEHVDRTEADRVRKNTAKQITQDKALQRGTTPGDNMMNWAKEELSPAKVNWRNQLRSAIRNAINYIAGSYQYSRSRMSRRQVHSPKAILPGLVHPVPEVAVVIDTSGSMLSAFSSGRQADAESLGTLLEQAMSETRDIVKSFGASVGVQVFATDTDVAWSGKVFNPNQIVIAGGGGTDITAGMNAAYNAQPRPQALIVLTDGATPWPPSAPPNMTTIIGIVGSSEDEIEGAGWGLPDWARSVIYITDD